MSILKQVISFEAGELSPMLEGRTDIAKYASGCRRLVNFIPTPQGALLKRPGLQRVGRVKQEVELAEEQAEEDADDTLPKNNNSYGAIVEFQITTHRSVMIVLGGRRAKFVDKGRMLYRKPSDDGRWKEEKDYQTGDRVHHDNSWWRAAANHRSLPLTDDPGDPENAPGTGGGASYWTLMDWINGHHYDLGDRVHYEGKIWQASVAHTATGAKAPAEGSSWWNRAEYKLFIPWADTELRDLRWKQINEVMYFVHPLHPPHVLTRFSGTVWTLAPVEFGLDVPLLDPNARPYRKITTSFDNDEDDIPTWAAESTYKRGKKVMDEDGKIWVCRSGHKANDGNMPGSPARFHDPDDDVYRLIWVRIFTDSSSEVGEEVTLKSNSSIFRAGHVGSTWEIAARRGAWKYEITHAADSDNADDEDGMNPKYSDVLIVQGPWSFITFGSWIGTFIIQISSDHGETWTNKHVYRSGGNEKRNYSDEGNEEKRVLMRLQFIKKEGAGIATDDPFARISVTEGRIRGLVRITGFVSPTEVKGISISPVEKTTTSVWSEGAWSDHQGYPRAIEFHQNRLLMAATTRRPHTIWGSAVDDYPNFKRGTAADESYAHTLAIGKRDPILWMDSDRLLVIGTGACEGTLHGEDPDSPITPEYGTWKRSSSYGSQAGGVGCIVSDSVSLFVQNGGRALREMAYTYQSDKYESANLNLLAEHLFRNSIQDVAIQRQPFQILWVVAGGQLFSLTLERSQNVVAWARHLVGGEVIATAFTRRFAEDIGYFLIRRDEKVWIERFSPGAFLDPKDDGTWQDGHITIEQTSYGYDLTKNHLVGKTVTAHAGGRALPPGILSQDYLAGLSGPVTVGIPYRAIAWPMTPEIPLANGTSRTRECRIHAIVPSVYRSRGGKFGPKPDGPLDPLRIGSPDQLFTGHIEKPFDGNFDPAGNFCIVHDEPYPFTLRNVTLKLNYFGDVR